MTERPVTERQEKILVWLLDNGTSPPSRIAYGIGMNKLPRIEGSGSGAGRGSGHRVFNPAQRIISSLVGLRNRGLVGMTGRSDGMSGTAYGLTEPGDYVARQLKQSPEREGE